MNEHRLPIFACAAACVVFAGYASAFRAGGVRRIEHVPPGTEFVAGHRAAYSPGEARLASDSFTKRHSGTWFERRGGPTGDFRRIWGEGVSMPPAAMGDDLVALEAAWRFWSDNGDLLPPGVVADDLEPVVNRVFAGVRHLTFLQTVDGVPVIGTSCFLAMLAGRVVLIGVMGFPVTGVDVVPRIGPAEARERALEHIGSRGVRGVEAGFAELWLMPITGEDSLELRLVWTVEAGSPGGMRFTAYIDAGTGGLVALRDERLFFTGQLRATHYERHPGSEVTDSPLANLRIQTNAGEGFTDEFGWFGASGTETDLLAMLEGRHVRVTNAVGDDLLLDVGGVGSAPYLWDLEGDEEGFAQIHGYHFIELVRGYANAIAPDLSWTNLVKQVNVNHTADTNDAGLSACNAWFDGVSVNTLMSGSIGPYDCNNTALIADVLYHEYGHAFHYQSALVGAMTFDVAVSEGFADTMSVAMTMDPIIAPHFTTAGHAIRDLDPIRVWPDDQADDPHTTGLIVGGALWSLRKALWEEYGTEQGNAVIDSIYAQVARTTTDVPSLYEATLLADDDNGNLADGTPHFCLIHEAYAPHGLAGGGIGLISIEHMQLEELADPRLPVRVEADVRVANEHCGTLGEVRLVYSLDDGENWSEVPMENAVGDSYLAEIGAFPEGTEIRYRVEADELDGGKVVTRPHNAAEPYYRVYVGPLEEIFCDDFEDEEKAMLWTHELLWGVPREGADDWHWGRPNGKGGDPTSAFSGEYVWGNDLAPFPNWDGKYQPNKINTLYSPAWDLSGYDHVRLRFRRWLTVEDGLYDQARIYVGRKGGHWDEVWVNYASEDIPGEPRNTHHIDREWVLFDLDISEWAAGQSEIQIRFELQSDAALQFGGWTIDDVCLYTKGEMPSSDTEQDQDVGADAVTGSAGGCGCAVAGGGVPAGLAGLLFGLM